MIMASKRSLWARWDRLLKVAGSGSPALTVLLARRIVADHPDFGPAWVTLGSALSRLGRVEEAERVLLNSLDLFPGSRHIPLSRTGHMAVEAGQYDRAAVFFRQVIEALPEDAGGYIFLGVVLAKQGRLVEAEDVLRWGTLCRE